MSLHLGRRSGHMDLSSLNSQARWRSGINDRANPIGAKTRAPRGAIVKDWSLQQSLAAHLLDEIRAPAQVNHLIGDTSAIQRLARETTRRAIRRRVDRKRRGIRGRVHHDSSFAPPRNTVNAHAPPSAWPRQCGILKGSRTASPVRLPGYPGWSQRPMRALSRNAIAQISCGSVVTTATAIWAFCFPSRPDRLARSGRLSFAMTQSPPLVGVNSPAGILLVRGRRRGGPPILSRTPINGTDTTSHCWQCWQCRHCWHLTVGCPPSLEQCQ